MPETKKNQDQSKTYLGLLQFDPKLLSSLSGRYLANVRLLVLLLLSIVAVGVMSYISLPRTLYPEVKIPVVTVATAFPGAGPNDVESLITVPLEKEIKRIKGIDTYSSSSQESVSVIAIEFESDYDPKEARDEVQAAVNKVTNLPDDALESEVRELDFENEPVWDFALIKTTDTDDAASLMRLADRLKHDLEDVAEVDRVQISGLDEREIQVLIKPDVIAENKIDPVTLSQAVSNALKAYPAGSVEAGNSSFALTIDQSAICVEDLRQIPVTFNDQDYQLFELADLSEQSKPGQSPAFLADADTSAEQTVIFSIYKTPGRRIDTTRETVQEIVDAVLEEAGPNYRIESVVDYASYIDDQITDLGENFQQTLLLVFLSMLLLYGIRQALIASFAIPLSLFLVFTVMSFYGFTVNFISLFSILIALGLFVDNAVVIIEAYTSYYKTGKFSPLETALLVWKDFFVELFSINLLTVWAFLPMLITTGVMGEFIKPIPIIVSVAMMGSAAIAFLFTLPSMMILSSLKFPKRVKILLFALVLMSILALVAVFVPYSILFIPTLIVALLLIMVFYWQQEILIVRFNAKISKNKYVNLFTKFFLRAFDRGFIGLDALSERYRKIVEHLLNSRSARIQTLLVIILFTILSYALKFFGFIPDEFFPKSDQDQIFVQLELPAGTKSSITQMKALEILDTLRMIPEAEFVTAQIQAASGSGFSMGAGSANSNEASFTIVLPSKDQRDRTSIEIAQSLREEFAPYQDSSIQILEESGGPPAGADIEINIFGPNLDQLQSYASEIENFLNQLEGTTNVDKSIKPGVSKIVFVPEPDKLQEQGLSEGQIAVWLRSFSSGWGLGDINIAQGNRETEYEITMRLTQDIMNPEEIGLLQIPIPGTSNAATLNELGSLELQANPTLITRQDGKRSITVSAAALPGYKSPELYKQVEKYLNTDLSLESSYSWSVGGVNEENQESQQSIVNAMGISAILILVTMVAQLGSFRKAIIVMLVIPLSVSGVFIWFALTSTPLSFPALIGLLSLFGIVIANSLMIVDKVNQNTEAGMTMKEAIIDASASRLEPIALTSASQVIGLIPITLADPIWRGMGGAIIAGLSFSGVLMLFFIPVVYYYFYPESK